MCFFYKKFFLLTIILFLFTNYVSFADMDSKVDYVVHRQLETIEIMKKFKGDAAIQHIVNKYFGELNFHWSARMAIGNYFKDLNDVEKNEYMIEYTKLFCYTWLDKFSYADGGFVKIKFRETSEKINDKDSNVYTTLLLPDGRSIEIVIRVREEKGKMSMLNIAVEGIDLAMSMRVQFFEYIDKNGSVQNLLTYLKERNKELEKTAKFTIPKIS